MANTKKLTPLELAWRTSNNTVNPLLSPEQDDKLVKYYRSNFLQYAAKYLYVIDDEGQIITLKLRRCQRVLHMMVDELHKAQGYVRILVPKARQVGVSLYIQALTAWRMRFWKNTDARLVSNSMANASKVFAMAQLYHTQLPDFIRPPLREKTKSLLTFGNRDEATRYQFPGLGSRLEISTAANPHIARGSHHHVVHLTEVGLWGDKAEDTLQAIEPSLHDYEPDTYGFMESTSAGDQGGFYEKTMRMRDMMSAGSKVEWQVVFLPAWLEDRNYDDLTDEEAIQIIKTCDPYELGLLKKFKYLYLPANVSEADAAVFPKPQTIHDMVEKIPRGAGFISWRRKKMQGLGGNKSVFDRENAPTLEEFFAATGQTLFDKQSLLFYREKTVRKDGRVGRLVVPNKKSGVRQKPIFIEDETGPLTIWEHPVPGMLYAAGADAALGKKADPEMSEEEATLQAAQDYRDFCSCEILAANLHQVAEYNSNVMDAASFGDEVYNLCNYYNQCLVMPETGCGSAGYALLDRLQTLHYPMIGRWEKPDSTTHHKKMDAFGWEINDRTKQKLVGDMQREIMRGAGRLYTKTMVDESNLPPLVLRSLELLRQLQGFAYLPGGGVGGRKNLHDDLVISLGLALIALRQAGGMTMQKVVQEIAEFVEDEDEALTCWEV